MPAGHNRAAGALTAETACELCRWRRAARGSPCTAKRARHVESNAPLQQQILSSSSIASRGQRGERRERSEKTDFSGSPMAEMVRAGRPTYGVGITSDSRCARDDMPSV